MNNAFEALQGKAAGVDITTSERPGTVGSIMIRGTRSISAGQGPLYVVDGVPLQAGGIETLNPRDIESIDILKDASSTAIYGSRGANGVVLVTTKRGQEGKTQVSYNGSLTFEKIVDKSPTTTQLPTNIPLVTSPHRSRTRTSSVVMTLPSPTL